METVNLVTFLLSQMLNTWSMSFKDSMRKISCVILNFRLKSRAQASRDATHVISACDLAAGDPN